MDGEKVMLSIKNGKYYNLGEVGSVIWGFIESPITVKQLIISLMDNYEVEEKVCTEQVLSFLSSLLEENIIQVEEKVSL
ncbi:lasso peptide biosynthesis PqqD family chaperone [Metabacillus sp. KUDC1714]|uniref:Lasso peptide biosynthesis PqqD family chaperone n=2 Tax=Metabacillus elymi TaxID=2745198 RepID=A0ABX6S9W1_9BACI|nr:lasso peptide biosynthesis PqqD family chaperone [Metabacillus sp. KUDC1714]